MPRPSFALYSWLQQSLQGWRIAEISIAPSHRGSGFTAIQRIE